MVDSLTKQKEEMAKFQETEMLKHLDLKYKNEIIRSMEWLGEKDDTIFMGQAVKYSGNAMYNTTKTIDDNKKIELPVFEDVQMGMSLGMAYEGFVPITCYPRFDFLICATNQLVNHLDKISIISEGQFQPRVIIRTSIGSRIPLDAGEQHTQDHTQAYRNLLKRVDVVVLDEWHDIFPAFKHAYERHPKSKYDSLVTLLIEWGDHYNAK
jgi:pyruvate/2-oxoglutarate/acetoin dehydrogenase E1 component|tara:strand:+ start:10791 stop:11417 length:627 start_codon:yes stop_codon:yes gene_type:complete